MKHCYDFVIVYTSHTRGGVNMEEQVVTINKNKDEIFTETKSEKEVYRPYHKALSSIEEAKKDYTKVTSDHVPFLTKIPLELPIGIQTEKGKERLTEIIIVSWNVLQDDDASGFAASGRSYSENATQRDDRHSLIANGQGQFNQNYHPQFFTFQEIDINKCGELYRKIKQQLGDSHYDCVYVKGNGVDIQSCVTIYNKILFNPVIGNKIENIDQLECHALGGNTIEFAPLGNDNLRIKITNVHAGVNALPLEHENNIEENLNIDDKKTLSIVIGDFNCTVAPLEPTPQNITTSLIPPTFMENQIQGGNAIDGAFYSYYSITERRVVYKQAKIQHLNPATGKAYTKEELKPIDVSTVPEAQKNEILRYRMVISVDESYKTNKVINNQYTIFKYEQCLKEKFNDNKILVRHARNLNNEEKIGVVLNNSLGKLLKSFNKPNIQIEGVDDGGIPRAIVLVNKNSTQELMLLLEQLHFHSNILELEKKEDQRNIATSFRNLYNSIYANPSVNLKNPSISIVVQHFSNEAAAHLANPNREVKEIEKSVQQLGVKLYGKPPLPTSVKTAIYTLIFTLIGAVAGFLVGAIPGAVLGGVAGGGVGARLGFFNGEVNQEVYKVEKSKVNKCMGDNIIQEIEHVNTALMQTMGATNS